MNKRIHFDVDIFNELNETLDCYESALDFPEEKDIYDCYAEILAAESKSYFLVNGNPHFRLHIVLLSWVWADHSEGGGTFESPYPVVESRDVDSPANLA